MSAYCDEVSTSVEVAQRKPRFAVLPVGSHEQHGGHLPLAADSLTARATAAQLARDLGGLLLPTIPYGTSYEHVGFAGTVTLRWSTLAALVNDVVSECWRQGIPLVFVLSGHGGNFILNPCIRDLNMLPERDRPQGYQVVLVPESVLAGDGRPGELHAGQGETSLLMAIAPAAVHQERAADFVPDEQRAELTNRPLSEISPTGVWGRPTLATREEGERMVAARAKRLRAYAERWLADIE